MSKLLTTARAADHLKTVYGIQRSIWWFNKTRVEGTGPAFVRVGRSVLYSPDDIQAWVTDTAEVRQHT